MTPGAFAFMAISWTLVLGLAGWSFARVLRSQREPSDREPPV